MKQAIAISLLLIHLFTATELFQLIKFPLMFEHFAEHKNHDSGLSFMKFLKIHYDSKTLVDEDYDQDMKLPFKSDEGCININLTAVISSPLSDLDLDPHVKETQTFFSYKESFLPSSFLSSIWQPPKSC